jgi:hypothetical protein
MTTKIWGHKRKNKAIHLLTFMGFSDSPTQEVFLASGTIACFSAYLIFVHPVLRVNISISTQKMQADFDIKIKKSLFMEPDIKYYKRLKKNKIHP